MLIGLEQYWGLEPFENKVNVRLRSPLRIHVKCQVMLRLSVQLFTLLSASGYGHSTPKTDFGKFFTMAYATIGIPLGLVMFNSIGERLNNFASIVINKLRKVQLSCLFAC